MLRRPFGAALGRATSVVKGKSLRRGSSRRSTDAAALSAFATAVEEPTLLLRAEGFVTVWAPAWCRSSSSMSMVKPTFYAPRRNDGGGRASVVPLYALTCLW